MDHLSPAPSFRPTRPVARSRNRHRTCPMSPSPRPAACRPFTEPSSTMFITTDYDRDCISPSSLDSDLIFNMSPIHSHFLSSSPSSAEPVDLMAWRGRTQGTIRRVTSSPPLSPLLYSFPRPSTAYMKQTTGNKHDSPFTSSFQNMGVPTLDRRVRTSCEPEAGPAVEARPLAASLFDTSTAPAKHGKSPKSASTPNPHRSSRLHAHPSSPIPIPRNKMRRSDPGPPVSRPAPSLILSLDYLHDMNDSALPSSGIASHVDLNPGGGDTPQPSARASPDASVASLTPIRRIEGFDDTECDTPDPDRDQALESAADSRSPATPGTAYSYAGRGPFRFSSFLDLRLEGPNGRLPGSEPAGGKDGRFLHGEWAEE